MTQNTNDYEKAYQESLKYYDEDGNMKLDVHSSNKERAFVLSKVFLFLVVRIIFWGIVASIVTYYLTTL